MENGNDGDDEDADEKEKYTRIQLDTNLLLRSSYSKFAVGTTIKNTTPTIVAIRARSTLTRHLHWHSKALSDNTIPDKYQNENVSLCCWNVFRGFCFCFEFRYAFFVILGIEMTFFATTTTPTTTTTAPATAMYTFSATQKTIGTQVYLQHAAARPRDEIMRDSHWTNNSHKW